MTSSTFARRKETDEENDPVANNEEQIQQTTQDDTGTNVGSVTYVGSMEQEYFTRLISNKKDNLIDQLTPKFPKGFVLVFGLREFVE